MTLPNRSIWQRSYIAFAIASLAIYFWHAGDDFYRGEVASEAAAAMALASLVLGVIFVFALLWSGRDRAYGYWIVLVLSLFVFWASYLSHALSLAGSHGMLEMATKTGAWAPVMVATSLAGGVVSATTVILAIYLLARPAARQG